MLIKNSGISTQHSIYSCENEASQIDNWNKQWQIVKIWIEQYAPCWIYAADFELRIGSIHVHWTPIEYIYIHHTCFNTPCYIWWTRAHVTTLDCHRQVQINNFTRHHHYTYMYIVHIYLRISFIYGWKKMVNLTFFLSFIGSLSSCILELTKFIVQIAAWEMCIVLLLILYLNVCLVFLTAVLCSHDWFFVNHYAHIVYFNQFLFFIWWSCYYHSNIFQCVYTIELISTYLNCNSKKSYACTVYTCHRINDRKKTHSNMYAKAERMNMRIYSKWYT